jgi:hypothetical protein
MMPIAASFLAARPGLALDQAAAKNVLSQIDRDEFAQLACQLVRTASPTGREKAIAEFIRAGFEGNGLRAEKISPRGRRVGARNDEIEIDAMVKAARLYAIMASDICSRERSQ